MNDAQDPSPPAGHDHDSCVSAAIETAEHLCRERGLRFTDLRRRVLALVWDSHKPIGAYDILDKLGTEGRAAAPPTVYRALDFLIEAGLVHRLDSLNAFIGCSDPARSHTGQFMICRQCRTVLEIHDAEIEAVVADKAEQRGFTAVHQMLEVQGLCACCSNAG
jgi:Fur family zinc uptake transcriptional regulator